MLLAARSASATSPPPGRWVVVAVGTCGDANLRANAALLREALSRQVPGAVLSAEAAQLRYGVFPAVTLERAQRGVEAIAAHYVATEFAEAYASAPAVEGVFERVPPSEETSQAGIAFRLQVIEALLHANQSAMASAETERLAELQPDFKIDPLQYPPSVQRAWAVAKTKLAVQPLAPLRIAGSRGAMIYLDGIRVGKAPLTLSVPPSANFDLQLAQGRDISRHFEVSAASVEFVGHLSVADEARFQAVPDLCFDAAGIDIESAERNLMRTLDLGGSGLFPVEPEIVDNVVMVALEPERTALFSAGLWSRSAGAMVRLAKVATTQGLTDAAWAAKLAQFVATGDRVPSAGPLITQ